LQNRHVVQGPGDLDDKPLLKCLRCAVAIGIDEDSPPWKRYLLPLGETDLLAAEEHREKQDK